MHCCSLCKIFLSLIVLNLEESLSCQVNEEDSFLIKTILERILVNDCKTMAKLSGLFFQNQEKPPNSVRVKYQLQVPYNSQCISECSCWKDACNSTNCEPGYCCFERNFLWGRIPMYIQDSIFRQLSMCSLVVGGIKEKAIIISLNVNNDSWSGGSSDGLRCINSSDFPCSWCHDGAGFGGDIVDADLVTDTVITVSRFRSPLDNALLTITAKLQGYAVEAEKLGWLYYSSELAFGYSEPYEETFPLAARMIMFNIYYASFQVIIFMLVYKYRYRIHNKICRYITKNEINKSLFWSLIISTLMAFACVLVIALLAGGTCMSVLQIMMLAIALAFLLPHSFVVCFRMKKTVSKLIVVSNPERFSCSVCNAIVSKLLLIYIYILPHVAMFWAINYIVSFIAKPFSYLLLLVYFCVSNVFIWIANAIGIHLLFPLSCDFRGSGCRRQIFALFLITACNCLNFSTWGFIEAYFYDRRAQATSFMTILPGIVFTLLGWYLSGDLVKLFDMLLVTFPKGSKSRQSTVDGEDQRLVDPSKDESTTAMSTDDSLDNYSFEDDEIPRRRYNFTRFKRMVEIVQRPTSAVIGAWTNSPRQDGYIDIDDSD